MQGITQAEFARINGCTRQYVSKLVRLGKIKKNADGTINPEEAKRQLKANSDPARALNDRVDAPQITASDSPVDSSPRFQDARTQREFANAEMAQLELRRMRGQLVEKKSIEQEMFKIFREIRERLLRAPHQMAGKLVTLKTEREIAAYIDEEINKILNLTADDLEKRSQCLPTPENSYQALPQTPYDQPHGLA